MLPGRPPQVTFGCEADNATCQFEFWIDKVESFYCALDHCTSSFQPGVTRNKTAVDCENIKCSCVTGRMLCGEAGSVGEYGSELCAGLNSRHSDISEFLDQEIRGPANFECRTGAGCNFKEPAMNNLIHDIFGDGYITLECKSGECLHYTQVPGFVVRDVLLLSSSIALMTRTAAEEHKCDMGCIELCCRSHHGRSCGRRYGESLCTFLSLTFQKVSGTLEGPMTRKASAIFVFQVMNKPL